jgi:BirA family biotin operon repressor/biotin-[acetyl-CoA-carboxylase] ligase
MARALGAAALLALVDALAPGGWQSGAALAAAAGVTRAALAKRIARLREWGLEIEAAAGRGYRLSRPLERLDAGRIRALLPHGARQRLRTLEVLALTDSTNQRLLEAPAANDPQACLAEMQSAGRGRRGRAWRSPFGANLYFSLAWRFAHWPAQLHTLPLAAGIAAARVLHDCGLRAVKLKWPNDLWVGAAKLGGILVEQRGEAGGECRAVIGVGVNYAMSARQAGALDQAWTTVQAVLGARAPSRNALTAALLGELVNALARFEAGGFAAFAASWSEFDALADQLVRVEGSGGALEGIARGIDAQGALIVEAAGARHHLYAGEVSVRPTCGTAT